MLRNLDRDSDPLIDMGVVDDDNQKNPSQKYFSSSGISFRQLILLVLIQSFCFGIILYYCIHSINNTNKQLIQYSSAVAMNNINNNDNNNNNNNNNHNNNNCPVCPPAPASCPSPSSSSSIALPASSSPSSSSSSSSSFPPRPVYDCGVSMRINPSNGIRNLLLLKLFQNNDPFCTFRNRFFIEPDWSYGHTHVTNQYTQWIIKNTFSSGLFIEAGSFKAGSAVKTAQAIRDAGLKEKAVLFCIDPFSGDTAMWLNRNNFWPWLLITDGAPRVYDQFMINVLDKQHHDIILPMAATSIIGFRAIERLQKEDKILPMVDALYLDSAHEKGETLEEIQIAYRLVKEGGIVYGDDWDWTAVREDITEFATTTQCGQLSVSKKPLPKKCKAFDHSDGWPTNLHGSNIDHLVPRDVQIILKVDPTIKYGAQWFLRKIELNEKELKEF